MNTLEEIEKKLCMLLDEIDTEALLSAFIAQLLFFPAGESMQDNIHPILIEIIAFYAIPRFGQNLNRKIELINIHECYQLAEEYLRHKILESYKHKNGNDIYAADLYSYIKINSDIVRGDSYPKQARQKIVEIQGKFDKEFNNKIGITPSKAIEFILTLIKKSESIFNENAIFFKEHGELYKYIYKNKKEFLLEEKNIFKVFKNSQEAYTYGFSEKLNEIMATNLPIKIESLIVNGANPSEQEVDGFKKLIGISKNTIDKDIKMQQFPLYILNSGKVIFNSSNIFDVLFNAFENIAKNEIFFQRYQSHKSKWLENKGYEYFERIFPKSSIYRTLDYPDINKGGTAELDIAIKWGNFILLIEAKAKQFRFQSMQGDMGRLRTDLKENIEDAYIQTIRAKKYITSVNQAIFLERHTNRKLIINKENIFKIYSISLSFNLLGGLSTQLKLCEELNLFKNLDELPFSICISDLDLITKANITPEVFLHYIHRRLSFSENEWGMDSDEINLFASYLHNRLDVKNLPMKSPVDKVYFHDYKRIFDDLVMYEQGISKNKPNIKLCIPESIAELLQRIKETKPNDTATIIFNILDLDDIFLEKISNAIQYIKNNLIPEGIFRILPIADEKIVVTILGCSPNTDIKLLEERAIRRAEIEKYNRKLNKSMALGLSFSLFSKKMNVTTFYIEKEWFKDKQIENTIEQHKKAIVGIHGKEPKRNALCMCGSGKKYKKCCLKLFW